MPKLSDLPDAVNSTGAVFVGVQEGATKKFNAALLGGGGGISDGDKGEITVSGSGASWAINAGAVTASKIGTAAVTNAKLQDGAVSGSKVADNGVALAKLATVAAGRLLGNSGGSSAAPSAVPLGTGLQFNGGALEITTIPTNYVLEASINGGAVTSGKIADGAVASAKIADGAVASAKIADDAVTYAKLQNVSATARVLGRATSGAGNAEELTLTQVLDMVGSAARGDILYRGASGWARLGAGTSGHVLKTQGAGADPVWGAETGGGGGGGSGPALKARVAFVEVGASGTGAAVGNGIPFGSIQTAWDALLAAWNAALGVGHWVLALGVGHHGTLNVDKWPLEITVVGSGAVSGSEVAQGSIFTLVGVDTVGGTNFTICGHNVWIDSLSITGAAGVNGGEGVAGGNGVSPGDCYLIGLNIEYFAAFAGGNGGTGGAGAPDEGNPVNGQPGGGGGSPGVLCIYDCAILDMADTAVRGGAGGNGGAGVDGGSAGSAGGSGVPGSVRVSGLRGREFGEAHQGGVLKLEDASMWTVNVQVAHSRLQYMSGIQAWAIWQTTYETEDLPSIVDHGWTSTVPSGF